VSSVTVVAGASRQGQRFARRCRRACPYRCG